MNTVLKKSNKKPWKGNKPKAHICVPNRPYAFCGREVKKYAETTDPGIEICEKCEKIMRELLKRNYRHVRENRIPGQARARV